jgi:tetratricopeptide (TPR) repeat protein
VVLRLSRLDREAVAHLIEAVGQGGPDDRRAGDSDAVDVLLEASEGLPIDLAERLTTLHDESPGAGIASGRSGPHGFRALLRDRLARVGDAAAQVLAAGAVIGRSFDLATVRAASGRSEEEVVGALEELMRRGLIRESASGSDLRFDFVHGSLRDAAYERISLVRRRLLHRRVADAIRAGLDRTAGAGGLSQLVLIAQHERDAGRSAEAAEAFLIAAEGARRIYAYREAIELVEAALALGQPAVGRLQRLVGELRLGLGEYGAAITAFEAATTEAVGLDLAELELLLGRAHARRGELGTAASHLDAALLAVRAELDHPAGRDGPAGRNALAGRAEPARVPVELLGRLLIERGVVALQAGETATAADAAAAALATGTHPGDRAVAGRAHRILGLVARAEGDLPRAQTALRLSLEVSATDPDPSAAVAAANALALVEAAAGDYAAAIAHLETALAGARRVGEPHLEAAIENNLADCFHAAGDAVQSMAHLRRAVELFAAIGGRPEEMEPAIWKLESW